MTKNIFMVFEYCKQFMHESQLALKYFPLSQDAMAGRLMK